MSTARLPLPITRPAWQDRLASLPGDPDHIPAFFFAHGSPVLTMSNNDSPNSNPQMRAFIDHGGLESPFANFLRDFGPALLAKYQPKGILVFSAHWETEGEQLGTCYILSSGRNCALSESGGRGGGGENKIRR